MLYLYLTTGTLSNSSFFIKKLFLSVSLLFVIGSQYLLLTATLHSTQPIYYSSVWALCYFSNSIYVLFLFSALLYLLPNLLQFVNSNYSHREVRFVSLEGLDLLKLVMTPLMLVFLVHSTWSGPSVAAWFGHILFSTFQFKVTYLLFAFFCTYILAFSLTTHFSSVNVYDFVLTTFNFFFWTWLTFFSNNIFTFIFFYWTFIRFSNFTFSYFDILVYPLLQPSIILKT